MRKFYLDFETRSRVELRQVGAHRYAEDPSTEIVCAAYCVDSGPVRLLTAEDFAAADLAGTDPFDGGLSNAVLVAHNAEFERLILRHQLGIDLPVRLCRCTQAQSARHGLPRGLEKAITALRLPGWDRERKTRLIRKLAKPRKSGEFWEREDAADDFEELEQDCQRDVESCRTLHTLLPELSPTEQAIWELTVSMNDRGIVLDLPGIDRAEVVCQAARERLGARWVALTGVPAGSPKGAAVLGLPSLTKADVRRALKCADLSPTVRESLEIRQQLARASVLKLAAMRTRACADGRLRGSLVYAGAERTARWSGSGVQPQNFMRGFSGDMEKAHEALASGALDLIYSDELRAVGEMLKGFFVGPWLVGDYGQIEARVLFWLARAVDGLAAFARGDDLYSHMATDIYGHPVTKPEKCACGGKKCNLCWDSNLRIAKRQLGKVAVLGCGYGLGWMKLADQVERDYDVILDPAVAQDAVNAYRNRYSAVPALWGYLERLAVAAVRRGPGVSLGAPGHKIRASVQEIAGSLFLLLHLPSGRALYYARPEIRTVEKFGEKKPAVFYYGRNIYAGGKWEHVPTYGGKLTENVVQAVSRDVMAEAMLRLDAAGFGLSLTVHDEIVSEGMADRLPDFERIMVAPPAWGQDIPLSVESFASRRYRK